jgi:putative tricarboxylic transport membrane protein
MHPDRIFGLGFIALAGVLYALNWQLTDAPTLGDPGPTLLPSVIAVAMALLGLRLTLKPAPAEQPAEDNASSPALSRAQWLTGIGSVANLLAYVVLLPLLGYLLATLIFFTLGARLLGNPGVKLLGIYALAALAITAISYALLTGVLDIHLPTGALFERFGE